MSGFYSSRIELAISDSSNRSYVIIIFSQSVSVSVRLGQASTKFIYALINFIPFRVQSPPQPKTVSDSDWDLKILPKATADNLSLHWSWSGCCQPTRIYICTVYILRFSGPCPCPAECYAPLLASVGHMSKNWRKFDQNFNWSPCSDSSLFALQSSVSKIDLAVRNFRTRVVIMLIEVASICERRTLPPILQDPNWGSGRKGGKFLRCVGAQPETDSPAAKTLKDTKVSQLILSKNANLQVEFCSIRLCQISRSLPTAPFSY